MKPISLWTGTKWIAAGAMIATTAAGCGGNNENDGVSDSIESPVVSKEGDKAMAGSDTSADTATNGATNTATNSATGAGTGTTGGAP